MSPAIYLARPHYVSVHRMLSYRYGARVASGHDAPASFFFLFSIVWGGERACRGRGGGRLWDITTVGARWCLQLRLFGDRTVAVMMPPPLLPQKEGFQWTERGGMGKGARGAGMEEVVGGKHVSCL